MKTKRNVIAAAALSVTLIAALAGCSGASPSGDDGQEFDGELKVGVLLPLTGGQSLVASLMQNAVEDFVADVNADGGVAGKKLTYEIYDEKNSPDEAARLTQRAISVDGVVAVTGAMGSGVSLSIKEVAERNQTVYVAPAVASPLFEEDATYSFRFNATANDLALRSGGIARELGVKSVSVLYDDGAVGQALADGIVNLLPESGVELAGPQISYPLDGNDMASAITTAKRQNPDAVIIAGSSGADAGLLLKTMVEQGLEVPVIAGAGGQLALPDAIDVGGAAYGELPGIYATQDTDTENELFTDFESAYEAAHDAAPNETVTHLYDALTSLVAGLEVTDGEGGDALASAIEGLEPRQGVSARLGSLIELGSGDHNAWEGAFGVVYEIQPDGSLLKSDIQLD